MECRKLVGFFGRVDKLIVGEEDEVDMGEEGEE